MYLKVKWTRPMKEETGNKVFSLFVNNMKCSEKFALLIY